jgi:hypothetical protein
MARKIYTEDVKLPAAWASALINDDYSGLSDSEAADVNAWVRDNPHYGGCFTCSDYAELSRFDGLLTDCLIYTFPVIFTRKNGELEYLLYPAHKFEKPLPWQSAGLQFTASGYGRKIPTSKVIYLGGRMYRIYCTICSNIGTCWVNVQGRRVIVD